MAHDSIFEEWKKSALGGFFNIVEYWRQRRALLREPNLIFDDSESRLKITPLAFALRGLLLFAVVFAVLIWAFETFSDLPPTPLDRMISKSKALEQKITNKQLQLGDLLDAVGTTPSHELIRIKKIQALSQTLQTLILPIGLTLTAYLFRRRLSKYAEQAPRVEQADRAYLYWVTARLFWPNIVVVVGIQALQFAARFELFAKDYLVEVLAIWLLAICGIWGLIVLRRAAPELTRILQLGELLGASHALRRTANALVISAVLTNIAILLLHSGIVSAYAMYLMPSAG